MWPQVLLEIDLKTTLDIICKNQDVLTPTDGTPNPIDCITLESIPKDREIRIFIKTAQDKLIVKSYDVLSLKQQLISTGKIMLADLNLLLNPDQVKLITNHPVVVPEDWIREHKRSNVERQQTYEADLRQYERSLTNDVSNAGQRQMSPNQRSQADQKLLTDQKSPPNQFRFDDILQTVRSLQAKCTLWIERLRMGQTIDRITLTEITMSVRVVIDNYVQAFNSAVPPDGGAADADRVWTFVAPNGRLCFNSFETIESELLKLRRLFVQLD